MLAPRSTIAAALLAACCFSAVTDAAAPCTLTETTQLDKLADSLGGLLRVCKTDSGFDLYPFKGYPPSDKATIICNGRSCPSVIYNMQQATLPACTVDVQGKAMTPSEYLTSLCPANGAGSTTTTAPSTTPAPSTTATTAPSGAPSATTSAPAITTSSPSSTTSAPSTTTATPSEPQSKDDGSSASKEGASSSVETPPATTEAAKVPTKATAVPTAAPASGVASPLVATGVLLIAVVTHVL